MLRCSERSTGKNSAGELAGHLVFEEESLSPTPDHLDRVDGHSRFLVLPPQLTQIIIFSSSWCRLQVDLSFFCFTSHKEIDYIWALGDHLSPMWRDRLRKKLT